MSVLKPMLYMIDNAINCVCIGHSSLLSIANCFCEVGENIDSTVPLHSLWELTLHWPEPRKHQPGDQRNSERLP